MDAEKIFQKALKKYESAEENIAQLSAVVQTLLPDYSKERALKDFDYMLQCVLLRQSLADGVMDEKEVAFIRGIVSHGDILEEIKDKLKVSLKSELLSSYTWENVYELPTLVQADLIEALEEFARTYIDELAFFSAVADAATKKNYYKAITFAMCSIIGYFAKIDGKKQSEEVNEGTLAYVDLFAEKYVAVKEFVHCLIEEGKTLMKELEKDAVALNKRIQQHLAETDTQELEKTFIELEKQLAEEIAQAMIEA